MTRVPLVDNLMDRMDRSIRAQREDCRPLIDEMLRAAWVDGYDALLDEVERTLLALPEDGRYGRVNSQTRYVLDTLRLSLPAWRAVSEEVRAYQRQYGHRDSDAIHRRTRQEAQP